MTTPRRATRMVAAVMGVALALRIAVVAWAAPRFPPTADGTFYQQIAERIAAGHGYTWLWPDGAVTYAAHYPVGYPGLVAAVYALVGPSPGAAMAVNAVFGAAAAGAVSATLLRVGAGYRRALIGGMLVAVHPALLSYTPALMTEGIIASGVAILAWLATRAAVATGRRQIAWWGVVGLFVGVMTLVRPQSLLFAPACAFLVGGTGVGWIRLRRKLGVAALAAVAALAVCAPWTVRNCDRMGHCALVSVNGGWNLLIGTDPAGQGAWAPVEVPQGCQTVWDEAEKDACFGHAARDRISADPWPWLALAPKKLAATFNYVGAGPWYLHASNPEAFSEPSKVVLGTIETVFVRFVLIAAWIALIRAGHAENEPKTRRWFRWLIGAAGVGFACSVTGWVSYALLPAFVAGTPTLRGRSGPLATVAALVIGLTVLVHAVFFGAGRYALVVLPMVTALAMVPRRPTHTATGQA